MLDKRDVHRESTYHIRVKGTLDEKWSNWFEGFVMTARGNGETALTGSVVDQAALQGVLAKLHSLGLPLLLVAQTGCPCPSKKCPRHGQCHECAAHYGDKGKGSYCFRAKTRWDKRCAEIMEAR
jgi:hypothetical protein